MSARKLSVSMPEEIAGAVAEAAQRDGLSLSAWLTRAAQAQLVARPDWGAAVRAAEELHEESVAMHGPISPEGRAWVDAVLDDIGLTRPDRAVG
jgi:hypothetical protein